MRSIEEMLVKFLNLHVNDPVASNLWPASNPAWAELYQLAAAHQVDTLLTHQLRKRDMIQYVPRQQALVWEKRILQNSARNLERYAQLERIVQVLSPKNIKIIILKGLFLADTVYKNIGIRRMGDIDLLVPRSQIKEAFNLLIDKAGYSINEEKAFSFNKAGHVSPLVSPKGIIVELHWTILPDGHSSEDIFQRAVPVTLRNIDVYALEPKDNILYLCRHVARHRFGFGGLRSIMDIAWVIEYYENRLDWEAIVSRSKQYGWNRIMFLSLVLAKQLAGANVPDQILAMLGELPNSEEMVSIAIEQLFSMDTDETNPVSDSLSDFWVEGNLIKKSGKLFQAIFIPKEKLAEIHQLDPNSPRIYWQYIQRIINLFRSHTGTLVQLGRGDDRINALVMRRNVLASWMDKQ